MATPNAAPRRDPSVDFMLRENNVDLPMAKAQQSQLHQVINLYLENENAVRSSFRIAPYIYVFVPRFVLQEQKIPRFDIAGQITVLEV